MANDSGQERGWKFLEREWPKIRVGGVIITLLALIPSVISAIINVIELDNYDLQATPNYERVEDDILNVLKREIIEEFFESVGELSRQDPSIPYYQHLSHVVPVARRVPAAPVKVIIPIVNNGNRSLDDVIVAVSAARVIANVQVDVLADSRITRGGRGQNRVSAFIERITKSETATVTVEFVPRAENLDSLVLDLDVEVNPSGTVGEPSKTPRLPGFKLIAADTSFYFENIEVQISSKDTKLQRFGLRHYNDIRGALPQLQQ